MSRDQNLSTADLAAASDRRAEPPQRRLDPHDPRQAQQAEPPLDAQRRGAVSQEEELAPLFPPEVASQFRQQWDSLQIGFVDDPRRTVQQADELVAQVMKTLASSFAQQRARLEPGPGQDPRAQPDTEHLRMALRAYRSFFRRLLSL
jgi:hypothetical protein